MRALIESCWLCVFVVVVGGCVSGTYHKNEAIESNKVVLKSKYDEAKSVGEAVNESRSEISKVSAMHLHVGRRLVWRASQKYAP